MLPARRRRWRMSPHTSSVLRPTRSRPRVRRRLTVELKKLVALSVNGSVHNFRAKSEISCLTTRSCATKSVGSYSIVDRLAQIIPSAQQSVHPVTLRVRGELLDTGDCPLRGVRTSQAVFYASASFRSDGESTVRPSANNESC